MAQKLTLRHLPIIIGTLANYIKAQIGLRYTDAEKKKLAELPTRSELETLIRDMTDQTLKKG